MQFNSNFAPSLSLHDGAVTVSGETTVEGAELVTRAVGLLQGTVVGHTTSTGIGRWQGVQVTGPFIKAPVTAIGTETYLVAAEEGRPPSFVTFSWTQIVSID